MEDDPGRIRAPDDAGGSRAFRAALAVSVVVHLGLAAVLGPLLRTPANRPPQVAPVLWGRLEAPREQTSPRAAPPPRRSPERPPVAVRAPARAAPRAELDPRPATPPPHESDPPAGAPVVPPRRGPPEVRVAEIPPTAPSSPEAGARKSDEPRSPPPARPVSASDSDRPPGGGGATAGASGHPSPGAGPGISAGFGTSLFGSGSGSGTAGNGRGSGTGEGTARESGRGAGGVPGGGGGDERALQGYRSAVYARIEAAKRYPAKAQAQRLAGRVVVAFALDLDGSLGEVRVAAPSGFPALDEAAVEAVRRGAPYPRFPAAADQMPAELRVAITFEAPR